MNVELNIRDNLIMDAIISGAEGGITAWAHLENWTLRGLLDVSLHLIERDGGTRHVVRGTWAHALRLMAEKHPRQFGTLLAGCGDQRTGDVLIQLATFGEVKYG